MSKLMVYIYMTGKHYNLVDITRQNTGSPQYNTLMFAKKYTKHKFRPVI